MFDSFAVVLFIEAETMQQIEVHLNEGACGVFGVEEFYLTEVL